jgi:GT2 family glycosyltransferase
MTSSPVTWVTPEMSSNVTTPTTSRVSGRVSIIIVSYNSIKDVDVCLSSVLKQDHPDFEVILSENDSTDGTIERVRRQYPRVKILQNNANLGYANGINAALPYASGEYIAPLNVDTDVTPGWLAAMAKVLVSDPQIGAVTPKILLFDDREHINTMGHNIHISGLTFCRNLNKPDYDSQIPEKVSGVSGCSYLIRRETLDKMGGLPRDSFMSNDDVIVSWLLQLMALKIYCVPKAVIYHKYRLKMNTEKLYRLEKDRSQLLLSTLSPLALILLSPVLIIIEIMIFAYCLVKGPGYLKSKFRAVSNACKERDAIRIKHQQYSKLKRVSDWSLIRQLKWNLEWKQLFGITR